MTKKIKISVFQQDVIWEDIEENIIKIEKAAEQARGSGILFLTEAFTTGFLPSKDTLYINNVSEQIISIAQKYNIAIAGTLLISVNGKFYNRFYFFMPDGNFLFYDKRHLFGIAGEDAIFENGTKQEVWEYGGIKIYPQVCFDLRFPVWSRNIFNYDLLVYPANWPVSRIDQWKKLLMARAIENQCYVVGINRIGTDGHGFVYPGKSLIINYKGEIIHELPENQEVVFNVELNFDKLYNARKKFPVLKYIDNFKIS